MARYVALIVLMAVLLSGCSSSRVELPQTPAAVDPAALRERGLKLLEEGRYPEATGALEKAARLRGTADDWDDYSYALGKLERWQDSLEAAHKAVGISTEHAHALYNLGWAEYKLGQYLQARTHIGMSAALQKHERWEPRYTLGLIAEALGEKSRAAVDYEAAAALAGEASQEPEQALLRVREFLPTPLPAPEGWESFTSPRFGFRIFYPRGWEPGPEPQNGDGRRFTSPDGKAVLTASGYFYPGQGKPAPEPGEEPFLYGFRGARLERGIRTVWLRAHRMEEKSSVEYMVRLEAPVADWPKLQTLAEQVLRSFRITFGNAYTNY